MGVFIVRVLIVPVQEEKDQMRRGASMPGMFDGQFILHIRRARQEDASPQIKVSYPLDAALKDD